MKPQPRVASNMAAPLSPAIQACKTSMATSFCGLEFASPLTNASGTFGTGYEFARITDVAALGAITSKGLAPVAWEGNPGIRIAETPQGMLNSIGLQNPGVDAFISNNLKAYRALVGSVPLIINVCGHEESDFAAVIRQLEACPEVCAYEINISCPNVDAGGMAFGTDAATAARIIAGVRELTERPLIAKLTPNVTDITPIARAVVDAGADAISLINTVLGMAIDARRRRPVLARGLGGLSGRAIKPVALRMVYEVSHAVDVPIIGMGGVSTGIDVAEFMLAGASMVALGTALFKDPQAPTRVLQELDSYCQEQGISQVSDLRGALLS